MPRVDVDVVADADAADADADDDDAAEDDAAADAVTARPTIRVCRAFRTNNTR